MRAIFGLGNPGSEYSGTRHNIGFDVLDAAAKRYNVRFRLQSGEYVSATIGDAVLVKPLTYMNNSGIVVAGLMESLRIAREEVLVVFDDLSLPVGVLRLRPGGGAGGHNGMASVLRETGTDLIPRLRCGIGGMKMPHRADLTDYVLSVFDREEAPAVDVMVDRAAATVLRFTESGSRAANDFLSQQP